MCEMKMEQAYVPTSSHSDHLVEPLYEDVESAITKVKTQYTILMGDSNAKVGKKEAETMQWGIWHRGSRNVRGELFVEF